LSNFQKRGVISENGSSASISQLRFEILLGQHVTGNPLEAFNERTQLLFGDGKPGGIFVSAELNQQSSHCFSAS
jgi:hypothetical protein